MSQEVVPKDLDIFSRISDVLWWATRTRERLTFVSPNCQRILGFGAEEFLSNGKLWISQIHEADRSYVLEEEEELRQGRTICHEYRFYRKDGRSRWISETIMPTLDEKGQLAGLLGVAKDITEQKQLEDQLVRCERTEALGKLTRGVAHELSNLLTVISGNAELIESSVASHENAVENLCDLRYATEEAGEIIQEILSFSAPGGAEPTWCEMNQLVRDSLRLIRRALGPRIDVVVEEAEEPGMVLADPRGIQQVLLHLCLRAVEAMPAGGSLRLSTEEVVLDGSEFSARYEPRSGRYSVLSIEHTVMPGGERSDRRPGSGEVGRRELATVHRIIQEHHGWVEVSSIGESAQTARIYLPLTKEVPSAEAPAEPIAAGDTGLLLVVEDVDMIAGFITTVMERQGYQVKVVRDLSKAREVISERGNDFSAAILGIEAGDASWGEFVKWLRSIDPCFPIVLTGGPMTKEETERMRSEEALAVLEKPFRGDQLARAVRSLLKSRSAS